MKRILAFNLLIAEGQEEICSVKAAPGWWGYSSRFNAVIFLKARAKKGGLKSKAKDYPRDVTRGIHSYITIDNSILCPIDVMPKAFTFEVLLRSSSLTLIHIDQMYLTISL